MRIALEVRDDGVVISTIRVEVLPFFGEYETAISFDGGKWKVLCGYATKSDALIYHQKLKGMTREEIENLDYVEDSFIWE